MIHDLSRFHDWPKVIVASLGSATKWRRMLFSWYSHDNHLDLDKLIFFWSPVLIAVRKRKLTSNCFVSMLVTILNNIDLGQNAYLEKTTLLCFTVQFLVHELHSMIITTYGSDLDSTQATVFASTAEYYITVQLWLFVGHEANFGKYFASFTSVLLILVGESTSYCRAILKNEHTKSVRHHKLLLCSGGSGIH